MLKCGMLRLNTIKINKHLFYSDWRVLLFEPFAEGMVIFMEATLNVETNKIAKLIVHALKYGKHYFIAYDEKDEMSVIENFIKHSNNSFIILKTANIKNFNKNSFNFYYENIDLNLLFSDADIINLDYAETNKVIFDDKYINYIYFYAVPDKTSNMIDSNNIKHYNSQVNKIMIQNVLQYCAFKEEILYDNRIFLKFSDLIFIHKREKQNEDFITLLGGIGDFFITFSTVYEYLENSRYENNYIMNWRDNRTFEYIANLLYGDKTKLLIPCDNKYGWEHWHNYTGERSLLSRKINNIFNTSKDNADTAASLFKKCLFGEKDIYYYKHNDILKKIILEAVSEEEKNYINEIVKSKKNNIGLQYFTGNFNEQDNEWDVFGDRKWDIDNIKEFIEQCRESNINLIILNSEAYDPSLQEFCTKKLSVFGYALLVSKMDLVVGVDSSAGHIASFYNIPSITLWGEASPLAYYGNKAYVGYRPLRKNYSIISRDTKLSSISCNIVFSLVKEFIENKLVFEDKIITYQDSVYGHNMLYI